MTRRDFGKGLAAILAAGVAPSVLAGGFRRGLAGRLAALSGEKGQCPYERYAGFGTPSMYALVDCADFGTIDGKLKDLSGNGDFTAAGVQIVDGAIEATNSKAAYRPIGQEVYSSFNSSGLSLSCCVDLSNAGSGCVYGVGYNEISANVLRASDMLIATCSTNGHYFWAAKNIVTIGTSFSPAEGKVSVYYNGELANIQSGNPFDKASIAAWYYWRDWLAILGSGRSQDGGGTSPSYGARVYSFRALRRPITASEAYDDYTVDMERFA